MEFTNMYQAVGSLGFPIAMCLIMFYAMIKQSNMHKEESEKMTEALNNNTVALNRIEVKLGVNKDGTNS